MIAVGVFLCSGAVSHATPTSVVPAIIFGQEDNPDVEFGQINYYVSKSSSYEPFFEISASITAIEGVDLSVIEDPYFSIDASQLLIYAQYQSTVVDENGIIITGLFGAMPGYDFELLAFYGETTDQLLLAGDLDDLDSLIITGKIGENTGEVSAMFKLTDGVLLEQFGPEAQLSASINLLEGTSFSHTLFDASFSGVIAGTITSTQSSEPIPEPGTFVLLSLGCAGLIAYRRKKAK